jgi:hypothetical protein
MRKILIDYACIRNAAKGDSGREKISIGETGEVPFQRPSIMIAHFEQYAAVSAPTLQETGAFLFRQLRSTCEEALHFGPLFRIKLGRAVSPAPEPTCCRSVASPQLIGKVGHTVRASFFENLRRSSALVI